MSSIGAYKIGLLNDSNYESWKLRMESILMKNDLWDYMPGKIIRTEDNETDFDRRDRKALSNVGSGILARRPNDAEYVLGQGNGDDSISAATRALQNDKASVINVDENDTTQVLRAAKNIV